MSTVAWIRRQRDRPIAEHERHSAMAAVVVILATVAVLLTLTQPASQARPRPQDTPPDPPATSESRASRSSAEADRTAERFLTGYLGYVYGHTPAKRIEDATPLLIHSLKARPPRVPPAARARYPRVLSLHPTASPTGGVTVSAVVNDGGLIDYPISLVLATEDGRLLVTGLQGAS